MAECDRAISTAFALIADLAVSLGVENIKEKYPDCWEHQIDDYWWIAVNGHKEAKKASMGIEVLPFHCYVEFNGFPAGIFSPFGGSIVAGKLANEDTFIKAIQKQIATTRPSGRKI